MSSQDKRDTSSPVGVAERVDLKMIAHIAEAATQEAEAKLRRS